MTFYLPLSLLLIPYGIVVVYVLVFSLINLQHLAHYGTSQSSAKVAVTVWFLGMMAIMLMTFGLLRGVDWNHKFTISPPSYGSETKIEYGI